MRASSAVQRRHEEEEESVFVSMTDMTIGFLFIVVLLLAFFASQYNPSDRVLRSEYDQVVAELDVANAEVTRLQDRLAMAESAVVSARKEIARLETRIDELEAELAKLREPNPLETYINNSMDARRQILERLKGVIADEFPDLKLVLTEESLRFQGEGLFKRAEYSLIPDRLRVVQVLADGLQQVLPCYTLGADAGFSADCNAGFALIEAVQIEGHTDSDGEDIANLVLSTNRATTTFRAMTDHQDALTSYLNFRQQPVLSVAGYGRMRPVASNDTNENKASNRRIDLRIIMHVPRDTDEIDRVRDALLGGEGLSDQ